MILEGDVDFTFRDHKTTLHAGDVINIPANAPHHFHNAPRPCADAYVATAQA